MTERAETFKTRRIHSIYNAKELVKISMLTAVAVALMYLEIPLAFFPAFLKIDLSDLPALVGGFAMGPLASILIELVKNIIHFIIKNDGTGGVGNLANFAVGIAFVVPASMVYFKMKSKKGALIGMGVGIAAMIIIASIVNYYILIPLYVKMYFNNNISGLFAVVQQANKAIVDVKGYILYAVVPFNAIKALGVSVVTLLIYKKLSPILHR